MHYSSVIFWPRRSRGLKTGEDERHFLAEVHVKFFIPHELQRKRHHWKNYKFILYLPFFTADICYQLANKTRNLLFAKQLLIYIIYGVGFVANLLNRLTDGATVSVRKNESEKELLFVRL
jgi:hypothetical protein